MLASIGAEYPVEAALAAAELLPHRPVAAARALSRGARVRFLVAAALDEAAGGEPPTGASHASDPPFGDGAPPSLLCSPLTALQRPVSL